MGSGPRQQTGGLCILSWVVLPKFGLCTPVPDETSEAEFMVK